MKRYVASTVLKYAIRTPIHSQNSSTAPTIRARQPQWHYENDDDWLAIIDKGFPGPVPRQYFTYANRSATHAPCPLPLAIENAAFDTFMKIGIGMRRKLILLECFVAVFFVRK